MQVYQITYFVLTKHKLSWNMSHGLTVFVKGISLLYQKFPIRVTAAHLVFDYHFIWLNMLTFESYKVIQVLKLLRKATLTKNDLI